MFRSPTLLHKASMNSAHPAGGWGVMACEHIIRPRKSLGQVSASASGYLINQQAA